MENLIFTVTEPEFKLILTHQKTQIRVPCDFLWLKEENLDFHKQIIFKNENKNILTQITKIEKQKLNSISETDCCKDGGFSPITRDLKQPQYAKLWNELNDELKWELNPDVWVLNFKLLSQ